MDRTEFSRLEDLPNVGPAIAAKLRRVDIEAPADLVGHDPYALFDELTIRTGERHDPCLLDVFISATRFMGGAPAKPWWAYTAERKAQLGKVQPPGEVTRVTRGETLEQKIERVSREEIVIVPYDPRWPALFQSEKEHLLACLPSDLIRRVEHFGSTSVPGLAAKPIVDILVEVTDLAVIKTRIAPLLEAQGYDYFWRPTHGDDVPPFYAWFIKRDPRTGLRTHHIHMVEGDFLYHWNQLRFRDYLIDHPETAAEYERLKVRLAAAHPCDRESYTNGKTEFILAVTEKALA